MASKLQQQNLESDSAVCWREKPEKVVRAYRVKYYADLVTKKPDLERFYFGWFKRALEV